MSISRKKGPLYLQIKKIMKDRILHGVYPIGATVPSEPQLEQEFNVSKMTVRNAIKELAQEGYVEKRSGIGTKVIRNTSLSKLSKGKRFTEVLVEEGHKIEKVQIKSSLIHNEEGTEIFTLFGQRCLRIERLYLLNGEPYIHYTHYVNEIIMTEEPEELAYQTLSLYDLIEEQHIELSSFRDRFTVANATEELEKLLKVSKGASLLKRLRYSYDADGRVMEYSVGHYNTEMHHYLVNYDS
ncbi:MAG: GntR family transcriptional regulator [Candidatus Pristimantibacillus sp.]